MQQLRFTFSSFLALTIFATAANVQAAQVTIDRTQRSQTIEGFGFFGAHDVWWGDEKNMVNEAWFDAVINDLGITIWRNEIYPPSDSMAEQDADWTKMKPVVQGLTDKAKTSGVPLKVILTVWTPPSSMKCAVTKNGLQDGTPHPSGTKNGGGLCPSKRTEFAKYLVAALKQYQDVGVNVYALSFQNEPFFVEAYNSCAYTQEEYTDTLAAIGPIIHAAYPNVKLFGAENMLAIETGGSDGFDSYWYTANIMSSQPALDQIGAWAVHGYSDGVLASPTSQMSKYWTSFYSGTASTKLPIWMTETSGYLDTIEPGTNPSGEATPGALDLAQSIYAALYHGHLSAWVWWQGSELGKDAPNEFVLMSSTTKRGKKYYVSKNFYRYIRPGAQMVQVTSDDSEVLVAAFDNDSSKAFTVIAINGGKTSKTVTLTGKNLPAEFQAYRTSTTENCDSVGTMTPATVTLPPRSITTLVNGNVTDDPTATVGGGSGGSGGTTSKDAGSGGTTGKDAGSGGTTGKDAGSGGTTSKDAGSGGTTRKDAGGGGSTTADAARGGAGGTTTVTGTGGARTGGTTSGNASAGNNSGGGCSVGSPASTQSSWLLGLLTLGLFFKRKRGAPSATTAGTNKPDGQSET